MVVTDYIKQLLSFIATDSYYIIFPLALRNNCCSRVLGDGVVHAIHNNIILCDTPSFKFRHSRRVARARRQSAKTTTAKALGCATMFDGPVLCLYYYYKSHVTRLVCAPPLPQDK